MGDDKTDPVQYQGQVPGGMSAQNIWPETMPEFKETLDRYYAVTKSFAESVLHLFALTLGLEETALDHLHDFPMCALRALHYPPQKPSEGAAGFLAHADFSCKISPASNAPSDSSLSKRSRWCCRVRSTGPDFKCSTPMATGSMLLHCPTRHSHVTWATICNPSHRGVLSLPSIALSTPLAESDTRCRSFFRQTLPLFYSLSYRHATIAISKKSSPMSPLANNSSVASCLRAVSTQPPNV